MKRHCKMRDQIVCQGYDMQVFSGIFRKVMVAVSMLFLCAAPAHAAPPSWQVSESSGPVSIISGASNRAAERGSALKAGDTISTAAGGRAVIVRGREYIVISPNSRISIAVPKDNGAVTQIIQYLGSALFKIEKKTMPHFGVKTPYLAAVVKGTTFNITVTGAGATVQVTEGRVEVLTSDGGASDLIIPGRIARVDANDRQLLRVLGTDERSIRSPMPAGAAAAAENGASGAADIVSPPASTPAPAPNPESPDAAGAENADGGSRAGDESTDRRESENADNQGENNQGENDRLGISDAGDSGGFGGGFDGRIDTSDTGDSGGFAGRIDAEIGGGPVNIALVTEGLINGNLGAERIDDRPGNGNSIANGNGNASPDSDDDAAPDGGDSNTPPAQDDDAAPGTTPPALDDDAAPGTTPPALDDDAAPGTTPPALDDNAVPGNTPPALDDDAAPGGGLDRFVGSGGDDDDDGGTVIGTGISIPGVFPDSGGGAGDDD